MPSSTRITTNSSAWSRELLKTVANVDDASKRIVRRGGLLVARNVKAEFRPRPSGSQRKSKTGRIWYDLKHYPPEPPRPTQRSGNTRNSIGVHKVAKVGAGRYMSQTYPTTIYSRALELGSTYSRPFPFLQPGTDKSMDGLKAIYEVEWATALRR